MSDNESLLFGIFRNIRSKRNRKRILQNIEIENENNKHIVRYKPSPIEAFFSPSDPLGNVMISGGIPLLRNRAIIGSLQSAVNNGIGIVILHAGNISLEAMVQQHYPGSVVFNRATAIYEPLMGLSNAEICRMIQEATTTQSDIPSAGQYYLEGMTEFIRSKNISPYCEMYITCPHLELFDKVDEAEMKGYITSALAQKIKTYLMQGQMHRSDVERYFNTGNEQLDMFSDIAKDEKQKRLDTAIDKLRQKYGNNIIQSAVVFKDPKLRDLDIKGEHVIHPYSFFKNNNNPPA